ncbi:hypothetical protein L1049_020414 [Liquidambar formosana]|uniref:Uncharacterized protein n=1 Tax=Liquidambar formosana TaxID=63359 RepID=A0AAP0SCQ3_LIQFO
MSLMMQGESRQSGANICNTYDIFTNLDLYIEESECKNLGCSIDFPRFIQLNLVCVIRDGVKCEVVKPLSGQVHPTHFTKNEKLFKDNFHFPLCPQHCRKTAFAMWLHLKLTIFCVGFRPIT